MMNNSSRTLEPWSFDIGKFKGKCKSNLTRLCLKSNTCVHYLSEAKQETTRCQIAPVDLNHKNVYKKWAITSAFIVL